jgi:hypothetical protein
VKPDFIESMPPGEVPGIDLAQRWGGCRWGEAVG